MSTPLSNIRKLKRYRGVILASIVGIGLIILWLRIINLRELGSYFGKLDPVLIIAASLLYVSAYFLRSLRWRYIISPLVKLSIPKAFGLSSIGYAINYLIPIRAGDVAQCLVLKRTNGIPVATSLPSVFIDRVMNLAPIFLVVLLAPFMSLELDTEFQISSLHLQARTLFISILALLLLLFLGLMIFLFLAVGQKQKIVSFTEHSLFMIPNRLRTKAVDFIDRFIDGMSILHDHPWNLIPVTMLTALIVLFDGSFFYVLFRALGDTPPFMDIFFGYTLLNLTYILPMPPAQLGTNEMFMWLIFSLGLGMDKDLTGSVMACGHLLTGFLFAIIGVISIRLLGVSRREAFSGNKDEGEDAIPE